MHVYICVCFMLSGNSIRGHFKLKGFYKQNGVCLLRGTACILNIIQVNHSFYRGKDVNID